MSSPMTMQNWVIGILRGDNASWLKSYVQSKFFTQAGEANKENTGFDVNRLVEIFFLIHAGAKYMPSLVRIIKDSVSSGVEIHTSNIELLKSLDTLISQQPESLCTSWLPSGTEKESYTSGLPKDFQYQTQKYTRRFFWYHNVLFMMESSPEARSVVSNSSPYNNQWGEQDDEDNDQNPYGTVTVRCFGNSAQPVRDLITVLEKNSKKDTSITVHEHKAGGQTKSFEVRQRPLSTVDLDPDLLSEIKQDAESFFHESTKDFCEATGLPNRRGYLFCGPPGTGKTTLSRALASYLNHPLHIMSLAGMNDEDLEQAFQSVPTSSIILCEELDLVGLPNRAQKDTTTPKIILTEAELQERIDSEVNKAQKQWQKNHVTPAPPPGHSWADVVRDPNLNEPSLPTSVLPPAPRSPKKITLGGLLNVIDGVLAPEGSLLILTTNSPKSLDPALYREGRVDRIFEINYASKTTAELTFKRLFGFGDQTRRFTLEAVNRMAIAFQDQFPTNSTISTAQLTGYCGKYRGCPDVAVLKFPEWIRRLKTGEEQFSYDINDVVDESASAGPINMPEIYDKALLELRPSDYEKPRTDSRLFSPKRTEVTERVGNQLALRQDQPPRSKKFHYMPSLQWFSLGHIESLPWLSDPASHAEPVKALTDGAVEDDLAEDISGRLLLEQLPFLER
ncbi:mitochondrial chaperone BCS1-B 1 [Paraphaeosphaeria sporulosa]